MPSTIIFESANPIEVLERQRVATQSVQRVRGICREIARKQAHQRLMEVSNRYGRHLAELKLEVGLTVKQMGTGALHIIRRIDGMGGKKPPVVYVHGSRHPINPLTLERA